MDEAGSTGKIFPPPPPGAGPARGSRERVPSLKKASIRSSLLPATISTSFAPGADGLLDLGGKIDRLELRLVAFVDVRLSATSSAIPTKPFSSPRGMASGTTARPKDRCSDSRVRRNEARSRSIRFTTMMRGIS
jgi:hypothetical protein